MNEDGEQLSLLAPPEDEQEERHNRGAEVPSACQLEHEHRWDKTIHDGMWDMFLFTYWQRPENKADLPNVKKELKDDVARLIRMTTQKTAGQRGKTDEISWSTLMPTEMRIICGAAILCLSGEFGDMPDKVSMD